MIAERLAGLAAQLGETPAEVARTLEDELTRAFAEIEVGMACGDAEAVGRATHAARNSVLMLDDRPMLQALRTLDRAMGLDEPATVAAWTELEGRWSRLAELLRAV